MIYIVFETQEYNPLFYGQQKLNLMIHYILKTTQIYIKFVFKKMRGISKRQKLPKLKMKNIHVAYFVTLYKHTYCTLLKLKTKNLPYQITYLK